MKSDINFRSLEELYQKIKPALYSKVLEIKRIKIDYIKEEDIWNYLAEHDWKERRNLTMADMVNDILTLDNDIIKSYVLDFLKNESRNVKYDEDFL